MGMVIEIVIKWWPLSLFDFFLHPYPLLFITSPSCTPPFIANTRSPHTVLYFSFVPSTASITLIRTVS